MDSEHWISRLAAAKRFYAAQLGHAGADRAGMDELDMDGDENAARPDFACPYCYEDHDVASLIAHLEEEHPFEAHAAHGDVVMILDHGGGHGGVVAGSRSSFGQPIHKDFSIGLFSISCCLSFVQQLGEEDGLRCHCYAKTMPKMA